MVEALCNVTIKRSRSKRASLYHTQSYKTTRNAIVYSHLPYFKVKRQSCGFYFSPAQRERCQGLCALAVLALEAMVWPHAAARIYMQSAYHHAMSVTMLR